MCSNSHQQGCWEESVSLFFKRSHKAQINLNFVIAYFQLSAKIKILKYTKYELSTEGETLINYSTVTTVTADSHSLRDTVDTDCLTVAALNKCYCRQINSKQGSYWRNSSPSIRMLMAVQYKYKRNFPNAGTNSSNNTNSQPFYKNFQGLFSVRPMF